MSYKRSNFPEQYDVFVEKADISPDKMPLVGEYHALFNKIERTEEEEARLDFLTKDLEPFLMTPEHINHYQDAMTNVQKFFKENTQGHVDRLQLETTEFVDTKKQEMLNYTDTKKQEVTEYTDTKKAEVQVEIDKFDYKGVYNPITNYFTKNVVDFNDGSGVQAYLCIKDSLGVEPTDPIHWKKLTIQGARGTKGSDGVGLKFKGRYDRTKTYAKDDGVQFGGVMFASLVEGNIDNEPSLAADTAYWAKALDVTITVSGAVGVRTVATDTDTVNFITGEIVAFNKDIDTLEVYQNSVRLTKGVDYEIGLDNQTIVKKVDIWEGSTESIFFEFFVIRNQINDLVFSDGQSIANGTVTKNKLSLDVQTEIDKMPILNEKVKPETPLNTISQDLSGAVNELKGKNDENVGQIGVLGTEIDSLSQRIDGIKFAKNVKSFTVSSIEQGTKIKALWQNNSDSTFVENILFVSNSDLTSSDFEYCEINATELYRGVDETFEHATSKNTLHYLKIFSVYSIGGEKHISTGASTQILTEDLTPPAKVTDISVKEDDKKITVFYTPPLDSDYMGTRLVYSTIANPAHINDGTVIANYVSGTDITGLLNNTKHFIRFFPYDVSGNYNTEDGQSIEATPIEIKIYGVEIDENNSNPETSVVYTDDAVGFTPMRGNSGVFQWGSWEQIFNSLEVKPCVVRNPQKTVNYYLNPNDYTKKLDGSPSDITSGTDGDVMVEFPKLYWKMWKVGTKQYVQWSTKMFEGAKCPAHTVGNIEKDRIYLPAYMGHNLSGKLRSLSGKTPTVNQTIGVFRNQAQANGEGYQQMGYYPLLMLQVLQIVFFKSQDSQTSLGRGYVDGNSASIATGGTNKKGMFYGETTGKQQNKFCGIEDFWGNVLYFIDGLYSNGSRNIMISKQDVFNDNGSGYVNHGQGASADIGGYIDSVQGGTDTGFIVKSSGGSSTTHYSDYGYLHAGRLAGFGGSWNYGSSAGAFQLDVARTAAHSTSRYGARLCVL